jgi:hypothetical protein
MKIKTLCTIAVLSACTTPQQPKDMDMFAQQYDHVAVFYTHQQPKGVLKKLEGTSCHVFDLNQTDEVTVLMFGQVNDKKYEAVLWCGPILPGQQSNLKDMGTVYNSVIREELPIYTYNKNTLERLILN